MPTCSLVICEPQPFWSRLLRPAARAVEIELRQTRSLEQLGPAVEQASHSVICVHVTGQNVAKFMVTAQRIKQNCPVAIVAMPIRALIPSAWRLYEFGVDQVVCSPLDLRATATLIRRHARRRLPVGEAIKTVEISQRNQIWKRLPWKRHASGGSV